MKYIFKIRRRQFLKKKQRGDIIDIEQIYLENKEYEERIRKTNQNDVINYYYTKQKKQENGESEIILNKKITKEEYSLLATSCPISDIIKKRRYIFVKDKQYYRLDEYKDTYILEIEVTDNNKTTNIPIGITIKKDLIKQKRKIIK